MLLLMQDFQSPKKTLDQGLPGVETDCPALIHPSQEN